MHLHLDLADGVPIYLQIVQQIKYLIAAGRLAPGEELPPIRALAERLLINPNTVARAYRELEQLRLLTKRSTTGTFVSDEAGQLLRQGALAELTSQVDVLVRQAQQQQLTLEDFLEIIRQRYRACSVSGAKSP